MIEMPVRFPDEGDVIAEEAARFRALSPLDQVKAFRSVLAAGWLMMKNSPNQEFLEQYTLEQEDLAVKNIKEFVSRHANTRRDSA